MKTKNVIQEPLRHFVEKHGVDISKIEKIICGQKYSAILLKNGNIGVCANLLEKVTVTINDLKTPDLSDSAHRIILNAYFCSLLNYSIPYEKTVDIFDAVEFKRYSHIVMVGLFQPVLDKFKKSNIAIHVFDKIKKSRRLIPLQEEMDYIKKADAVILTATSISNGTFMDIVAFSGEFCDIFILGPSAIMDSDMFRYQNIKKVFGAVFAPFDERVLDTIKQGFGTKKFIRFARKVTNCKEEDF
jgi:uncharacterized protein (DUF4213/DUF364 family)